MSGFGLLFNRSRYPSLKMLKELLLKISSKRNQLAAKEARKNR